MNDLHAMKTFAKRLEEPFSASCLQGVQGERKTGHIVLSSPRATWLGLDQDVPRSERHPDSNQEQRPGDDSGSRTQNFEKKAEDGCYDMTPGRSSVVGEGDGRKKDNDENRDNRFLMNSGNCEPHGAVPEGQRHVEDLSQKSRPCNSLHGKGDTLSESKDARKDSHPEVLSCLDHNTVILTSKVAGETFQQVNSENVTSQQRDLHVRGESGACMTTEYDSSASGEEEEDEELEVTCSPEPDDDRRTFLQRHRVKEPRTPNQTSALTQAPSGPESLEDVVGSETDDTRQTFDSRDNDGVDVMGSEEGEGSGVEEKVGSVTLYGYPIVCLRVEGKERLCLAQISSTLLQDFSYNEIHNRRVALGITCLQCSPHQLEALRRAGAMPISSRRCGLITKREAERLVRSFFSDVPPPRLPDNFTFKVRHSCGWGCEGYFLPARYNSSRAKCIKCCTCDAYFSPNKFIFHYHRLDGATYRHPDAANFNSWRRHLELVHDGHDESESDDRVLHAWEDVKAMFNGGSRKRLGAPSAGFSANSSSPSSSASSSSSSVGSLPPPSSSVSFPPPLSGSLPLSASAASYRPELGSANMGASISSSFWPLQQPGAGNLASQLAANPIPQTPAAQLISSTAAASHLLSQPAAVLAAAGAHPAFYGNGFGRIASYGEFLRSMSLPYNTSSGSSTNNSNNNSNNSSSMAGPPVTNSVLGDWHRLRLSTLMPVAAVTPPSPGGLFAAPSYPMTPCFGFRRGFGGASDGGRTQPMSLPVCPPGAGTPGAPMSNSGLLAVSAPGGTNDHPRVQAATLQDLFRKHSPGMDEAQRALVVSAKVGGSRRYDLGKSEGHRVKQADDTTTTVNLTPDNNASAQREAENFLLVDSTVTNAKVMKGAKTDEGNMTDTVTNHRPGVPPLRTRKDPDPKKKQAAALPKDTETLLKIFEETNDVELFVNLPIGKLRRLLKTARAKSQAVDREICKIKDMQRLQRLRAAELREEFSRQFFTLKENVWTDIEHERRLKTALQNKLAEAKHLMPKILNPSLPAYPDLK